MATGTDVLTMLCADVEWTIYGDDYESIIWHKGKIPITEKQFTDGFAQFDAYKIAQDAAKATQKANAQNKLAALGLTVEDLQALGL